MNINTIHVHNVYSRPNLWSRNWTCGGRKIESMDIPQEFYRIQKLPPYVFAVINEMKAKARAAQLDVVDLGMGNPDGATPRSVVSKLAEAARNPRNHRYSASRGIPRLREAIVKRYKTNYGVDLDPDQ